MGRKGSSKGRLDKKAWLMIGTAATLLTLMILSYLIIGLLNGFTWANHLIFTNPIEVFFLISLLISLIPIYHKADNRFVQAAKQLGFSGMMIMIPSTLTSGWYWFNPPTGGIERAVQGLAGVLMTASTFKLITAVYLQKAAAKKKKQKPA